MMVLSHLLRKHIYISCFPGYFPLHLTFNFWKFSYQAFCVVVTLDRAIFHAFMGFLKCKGWISEGNVQNVCYLKEYSLDFYEILEAKKTQKFDTL